MIKRFLIMAILASGTGFAALPGPAIQPYFQQAPTTTSTTLQDKPYTPTITRPTPNLGTQTPARSTVTSPPSITKQRAVTTPAPIISSPVTPPSQVTPPTLLHSGMKPTPLPPNRLKASPLEHKSMTPTPLTPNRLAPSNPI